jgi:metallo-beta-lactamase class B
MDPGLRRDDEQKHNAHHLNMKYTLLNMKHILLAFVVMTAFIGTANAKQPKPVAPVPTCPANAKPTEGWDTRAPPRKIFGNTYYVGTCGLSSILVTSPRGHVLIDGATEKAGPLIEANVRKLGFDPKDIKLILNSHEHFDHAAGIAYLQGITGADMAARSPAVATLQRGQSDRSDPQFLDLQKFLPVANIRTIADGETVHVGELALTAHATPGHTPGSTSWVWQSCEDKRCLNIAYADSLSALSDKQYRYGTTPGVADAFARTFDTVAALPCNILLTPHPAASNLFARLDGKAPLVDTDACKHYADNAHKNFEQRLQDEKD